MYIFVWMYAIYMWVPTKSRRGHQTSHFCWTVKGALGHHKNILWNHPLECECLTHAPGGSLLTTEGDKVASTSKSPDSLVGILWRQPGRVFGALVTVGESEAPHLVLQIRVVLGYSQWLGGPSLEPLSRESRLCCFVCVSWNFRVAGFLRALAGGGRGKPRESLSSSLYLKVPCCLPFLSTCQSLALCLMYCAQELAL